MNKNGWFTQFASAMSSYAGKPVTFFLAAAIVVVWAISGPFMGFSDVWQLTINTGTTIITFLMVFIIQNTQNRDTAALHIKMDELIRATEGAHNSLLDLEELSEEDLKQFRDKYEALARRSRETGQAKVPLEVENN
jgi:low affinity Fe/Cu permease